MSTYQGSGGISGCARGIPPHGLKTNGAERKRRNKYADMKPSEQKNTAGQRRAARREKA